MLEHKPVSHEYSGDFRTIDVGKVSVVVNKDR